MTATPNQKSARKFLPCVRITKSADGFELYVDGVVTTHALRRDAKLAGIAAQLAVAHEHYTETKSLRDYKRVSRLTREQMNLEAAVKS